MKKHEAAKVIEKLLERIEVTNEEEQALRKAVKALRRSEQCKNS